MSQTKDNKSFGELFSELSRETTNLVRQEILLAKTEVTEKVTKTTKNALLLVIGGVTAHTAALFILAAIAVGLAQFMQMWLAILLVGVVLIVIALLLIQSGRAALKATSLVPNKTIETLKEDKEWVQQQVK